MTSRESEGLGNKPLIVLIGLIAACIGIFTFVTGRQSITEIVGGPPTESSPTANGLAADTARQLSATAIPPAQSQMPSPTSTPSARVVETALLEEGENYRIEQISNGQTLAKVYLIVPSGFPLGDLKLQVYPAVNDIAGNWQLASTYGTGWSQLSPQGTVEWPLEEGDYVLVQSHTFGDSIISGKWGNDAFQYQGVVFAVRDGWTTVVNITISKLEIGVLDPTNTFVPSNMAANLHCQGRDLAGQVISDLDCDGIASRNDDGAWKWLDTTGIALFWTGPGTYFVGVFGYDHGTKYHYDIEISAGEEKRLIFNYP